MASTKRELEYEINRNHYREIQKGFKFGFKSTVIPSGAAFVLMWLYYAFRGLALLAGARMVIGQYIVNNEMDAADRVSTGLGYTIDFVFLGYVLAVAVLAVLEYVFKRKSFNKLLLLLFIVGILYGLYGLLTGSFGVAKGLFFFALGVYGTWLEFYLLRLHKELDVLSLKEGYPDFIIALNEPKTMANTSGLTYKSSEFQKRQRKEEGYEKMSNDAAMDELTLDTELPKGTRKIDNMM